MKKSYSILFICMFAFLLALGGGFLLGNSLFANSASQETAIPEETEAYVPSNIIIEEGGGGAHSSTYNVYVYADTGGTVKNHSGGSWVTSFVVSVPYNKAIHSSNSSKNWWTDDYNTYVDAYAQANSGYQFVEWTWGGYSAVTTTINVYARFVQYKTVYVTTSGTGGSFSLSGGNTNGSYYIYNVPVSSSYGATVSVSGNKLTVNGTTITANTSSNTAQYTYSFNGFNYSNGSRLSGDTILVYFSRSTNYYSVYFYTSGSTGYSGWYDDSSSVYVPYGTGISSSSQSVTVSGYTTRNAYCGGTDWQYSRWWSGWSHPSSVTGTTYVYACFGASLRYYDVRFYTSGDTGYSGWYDNSATVSSVAAGTTISVSGQSVTVAGYTTRYATCGDSDAQYSRYWNGWSLYCSNCGWVSYSHDVHGNMNVYANFGADLKYYASDLNTWYPGAGTQGGATVNITYSGVRTVNDITNETWDCSAALHPYGTVVYVSNIRPSTGTHLTSITLAGSGMSWNGSSYEGTMYGNANVDVYTDYNTYTVYFNGNGNTGGSTADQGFTYGTAQNLRANGFTKTGYSFGGWATSANASKAYDNGQSVNNLTTTHGGSVTLYAKWNINYYTVKFSTSGSSGYWDDSAEISVPYGTTMSTSGNALTITDQTVRRAYASSATAQYTYSFTGFSNTGTVTGARTVYACFSATTNSYYLDLNFTLDGAGIGSAPNSTVDFIVGGTNNNCTDYYAQHPYGTKFQVSKVNYNSAQYDVSYTTGEQTLTGYVSFVVAFTTKTYWTNVNLCNPSGAEAQPSCTVTIDYNGTAKANQTNEEAIYIPYGGYIAVSNISPSTGMHFGTVSGATDQGGGVYKYVVTGTGNINVTMAWNTYTVKFNGNGATGGSTADQGFTYSTAQNLRANGFTKTGYSFAGWATSANASKAYDNGQSVNNLTSTHGGTVNLYAKWTQNTYSLQYNSNGGNAKSAVNKVYDTTYTSSELSDPGRTGYTFVGWYNNSSLSTKLTTSSNFDTSKATFANVGSAGTAATVYAKWTANQYTVTYTANGGNGANQTQTVTYDSSFTTKPNTIFTKTGYTLTGWGGSYSAVNTAYTYKTAGNTTLNAQWTANPYTVTYKANGGVENDITQSVVYDSNFTTQPINTFTRDGYVHIGWEGDYTAASTTYKYSTAGNAVLNAKWQDTWQNHATAVALVDGWYKVKNAAELAWIAYKVNVDGLTNIKVKIAGEIDLSSNYWYPIGTAEHPFQGEFDGGYVLISGLRLLGQTNGGTTGLFGKIGDSSIIKRVNISLQDVHGDNNVGGIAGYAKGSVQFMDNLVRGSVQGGTYAGGIVGLFEGSGDYHYIRQSVVIGGAIAGNTIGVLAGKVTGATVETSLGTSSTNVALVGNGNAVNCILNAGQDMTGVSGWTRLPFSLGVEPYVIGYWVPTEMYWIAQAV